MKSKHAEQNIQNKNTFLFNWIKKWTETVDDFDGAQDYRKNVNLIKHRITHYPSRLVKSSSKMNPLKHLLKAEVYKLPNRNREYPVKQMSLRHDDGGAAGYPIYHGRYQDYRHQSARVYVC